jgi:DNA-binding NarL/FixJ family response regulator
VLQLQALPQHASKNHHVGTGLHQLLHQVTDQIDFGLVVCDADGQMLHANRSATRELASQRVLQLQDGRVRSPGPDASELASAIKAAATQGRRRLLCLQDAPPLMLVVLPLDSQADGERLVLLMIGRRTVCTALGLELLAIQHRLTLAEQRVLRAIVGGTASRDIAVENGVAVSTVRTQIQSLRDKLGVGNIDALLLTAARVPPVPSSH